MKKNSLIILAFFISLVSSVSAVAAPPSMVQLEYAIESNALSIRLSNDLTGIIKGRRCDTCEVELLKITPATKLEINGVVTDLIKAKTCCSGKPGTVIYNINTREVRVISSYQ